MAKELIMYARQNPCPFVMTARRVLTELGVNYQEVSIDADEAARLRVLAWTGFLSVPTLVVAEAGEALPYEAPLPIPPGKSPRGINRGVMITEPNADELKMWLRQHGFVAGV